MYQKHLYLRLPHLFFYFQMIKYTLNIIFKFLFLLRISWCQTFFSLLQICSFLGLFRASAQRLKVVISGSYLMSSRISIPRVWTKFYFLYISHFHYHYFGIF